MKLLELKGLYNSSKEKEKELRDIIFERSKNNQKKLRIVKSFQNPKSKSPEEINKYLEKITFQKNKWVQLI